MRSVARTPYVNASGRMRDKEVSVFRASMFSAGAWTSAKVVWMFSKLIIQPSNFFSWMVQVFLSCFIFSSLSLLAAVVPAF